ncbi:MAG: phosphate ABC transporter ATP-binding protein [Anaerolineae bacterium]|nr:phosphate ABC transporter ATP-binding protein [Anaerolineae bacterium]
MTVSNKSTHAQIIIRNLFFTYGDGTEALTNISLDINAHEIFVLFGPARSGKSTLLRLLNRLSDLTDNAHHQGRILFNGRDIFERGINVSELRRRISMVFALPTPLPGSIRDNLTYGLRMAGIRDGAILEERVIRSLKQAALWDEVKDRLDQSAFALSGGQKQRLCLARSLALEPEVILLDNPTSGLDPLSTGVVEESLVELRKRYTILMVPHSVQQAARVADRAGFLLDGDLIEVGLVGALFTTPQDQRTEDYITGRFG